MLKLQKKIKIYKKILVFYSKMLYNVKGQKY